MTEDFEMVGSLKLASWAASTLDGWVHLFLAYNGKDLACGCTRDPIDNELLWEGSARGAQSDEKM